MMLRIGRNSAEDARLEDIMDDEYIDKVDAFTQPLTSKDFMKSHSAHNKDRRHSIMSHILSKSNAMNTELEIAEESNENSIDSKNFSIKI